MNKKRKISIVSVILSLSIITGCSSMSVKTYPSIDLPFEIVDRLIEEGEYNNPEAINEYQELKEVSVRDLTEEENREMKDRMEFNTLNDLNKEYSVVEFSFGEINILIRSEASLIRFDKDNSYFVYDDEIIMDTLYQLPINFESLYTGEVSRDGVKAIYGSTSDDFKNLVLIRDENLKKGLQFRTIINDEEIYIDIK